MLTLYSISRSCIHQRSKLSLDIRSTLPFLRSSIIFSVPVQCSVLLFIYLCSNVLHCSSLPGSDHLRSFHTVVYKVFSSASKSSMFVTEVGSPVFSLVSSIGLFCCRSYLCLPISEWVVQFSVCSDISHCVPPFAACIPSLRSHLFFTDRKTSCGSHMISVGAFFCWLSGRYFLRRCTTTDVCRIQFYSCQFSPLISSTAQLRTGSHSLYSVWCMDTPLKSPQALSTESLSSEDALSSVGGFTLARVIRKKSFPSASRLPPLPLLNTEHLLFFSY